VPEELLQRMRDIHYPDDPGWFPPAPGWWLLLLLIALAIAWLAFKWRARQRARAPYAIALELLHSANNRVASGELGTRDYLDQCNQILKRLLVHVRHNDRAVSASGTGWLAELDRLNGGHQFTDGAGKSLGDSRFAPEPPAPEPGLHKLLTAFVRRLQSKDEEEQSLSDSVEPTTLVKPTATERTAAASASS